MGVYNASPYLYMGRYCPKAWKNRGKVHFSLWITPNLQYINSKYGILEYSITPQEEKKGKRERAKEAGKKKKEGRRKEERGRGENKKNSGGRIFGERFSRTRVGARVPTAMLFFCCHKCHTWMKTREKRERKCRKNEGNIREKSARKTMSFDVVGRIFGKKPHSFVKTHQRKDANCWYKELYTIGCDTCDSKNTKTPVMYAYAYARTRESQWLHVFSQFNFSLPLLLLAATKKRHVVLEKTIRCFMKNDPSFYEKQAVVLPETFNAAFFGLSAVVNNLHYLCTSIRPRGLAISHNL